VYTVHRSDLMLKKFNIKRPGHPPPYPFPPLSQNLSISSISLPQLGDLVYEVYWNETSSTWYPADGSDGSTMAES